MKGGMWRPFNRICLVGDVDEARDWLKTYIYIYIYIFIYMHFVRQ